LAFRNPNSVYYFREDDPLTEIRANLRSNRGSKVSTLGAIAVICLVLVLLLAVAQVTHAHPVGSDTDHCPLCIAMHSIVPFVVMLVAVVLAPIGRAEPVFHEDRTVVRYWHPTLFNRPPPAYS
jgi:hypothetical protein